MTGYVVTRWYRAPEVILNWMHYNQTGELSCFSSVTVWWQAWGFRCHTWVKSHVILQMFFFFIISVPWSRASPKAVAWLPKLLPAGNDESRDFSSVERTGEGGKWKWNLNRCLLQATAPAITAAFLPSLFFFFFLLFLSEQWISGLSAVSWQKCWLEKRCLKEKTVSFQAEPFPWGGVIILGVCGRAFMNEATEKNRCQSGLPGRNRRDPSFWWGKQRGHRRGPSHP